jgi:hypothetical protein
MRGMLAKGSLAGVDGGRRRRTAKKPLSEQRRGADGATPYKPGEAQGGGSGEGWSGAVVRVVRRTRRTKARQRASWAWERVW